MSTLSEALAGSFRNVLIIGTIPISGPEIARVVQERIFSRILSDDLQCEVIAESDNQLFEHSLRTDTPHYPDPEGRLTFTQLKFRRALFERSLGAVRDAGGRASFLTSTLPLSVFIVQVDERVWYIPAFAYPVGLERFRELTAGDPWFEMIQNYLAQLRRRDSDGRFLTAPGKELLELFDQDRIPRGIYPRDCFYDTDHYQFVVWDFVFARDGRLLIHQRAINAKDNQGMWDKSVGGHVDFVRERSSATAAVRELIEELYTKEKREQSGHEYSLLSEDVSKVQFLGDWRSDRIPSELLKSVSEYEKSVKAGEEPWFFFQLPGTIEHNTPRLLSDGTERRLRVLADVFVFISNTVLTPEYARKELKNSKFILIEPAVLKTWIERAVDDRGDSFVATPDLRFIMSGRFRDRIDEVSQVIKYSNLRRAAQA